MFSTRLNVLMNLTGSTNEEIAKALSLDPSYLSRLRNGSRALPKAPKFLDKMSEFFYTKISKNVTMRSHYEFVRKKELPYSPKDGAKDIGEWLSAAAPAAEHNHDIEEFLHEVQEINSSRPTAAMHNINYLNSRKSNYYHGVYGKREAMIRFFMNVIAGREKQTVYIYSDENLSWLINNQEFTKLWSNYIHKILNLGNKVVLIQSVASDSTDLWRAISKWLPLYMTGNINSFYCPQQRESPLRKTMYVAPLTGAVLSNSIYDRPDNMLNNYITDKHALQTLTNQFEDLLSICKPLISIYNPITFNRFATFIYLFDRIAKDTITSSSTFSLITLPTAAAELMGRRISNSQFAKYVEMRGNALRELLEGGYTADDLICLPTEEQIKQNRVPLSLSGMSGTPLYYTREELILHVENVIHLLNNYPNYRVTIVEANGIGWIYSKDGGGAILGKTVYPYLAFKMSEPNISGGIHEYLASMVEPQNKTTRKKHMKKLWELLKRLKED